MKIFSNEQNISIKSASIGKISEHCSESEVAQGI